MSDVNELSRAVGHLLKTAGWTPERRVDVGPLVGGLARQGFVVSADAVDFFAAFSGLIVRVPSPSSLNPTRTSQLTIDPSEAATCCSAQDAQDWGAKFSDSLVPLATRNDDASIILLGREGALYSVYDQDVAFLGAGMQGIERLLNGQGAVEVR